MREILIGIVVIATLTFGVGVIDGVQAMLAKRNAQYAALTAALAR